MDIQLIFETSASAAPTGFTAAMDYAAAQLDALLTKNITVSIDVAWDSSGSILGEAGPYLSSAGQFSYATVVAALRAHAVNQTQLDALADLPSTDPTGGNGIALTYAQAEALGLATTSFYSAIGGIDGVVEFGTGGGVLNFGTTGTAVAGEIDFVGTAEHELTHALGRIDFNDGTDFTIMDLYAYAAPGTLQSTPDATAYFSTDGGNTTLATFDNTSDISDWADQVQYRTDAFGAYAYPGYADTITAVDDTLLNVLGFDVACFCPGTRILTPGGERPVEQLGIGDLVATPSGARPVKWIGRSVHDGRVLGSDPLGLPVTFLPGALGAGQPCRPMRVSPGHGVLLHGVLVPAWRLVNGVNVLQPRCAGPVAYLHLELDSHDLLCADGAWSESFLAETPRGWFHNAAEYAALYPGPESPSAPCRARVEEGLALLALQDWVRGRAGLARLAEADGALQGVVDEAGPDLCAGWAWCPSQKERPVTLLVMGGGEVLARLPANRYRADLRRAGIGQGCHGFSVVLPLGWRGPLSVRRAGDGAALPIAQPLAA